MTRHYKTGILTSLILAAAWIACGAEAKSEPNKNKTEATTTATPYAAKKAFEKDVKAAVNGGKTTPKGWLDDFSLAKTLSQKYSRPVLVLFTEANTNAPAAKLWTEVLSKREFRNFASAKLVLLYIDNTPATLSAEQAAKNAAVVQELTPAGTAPSTILLSPAGKNIGTISGFQANYLDLVKGFVEKK